MCGFARRLSPPTTSQKVAGNSQVVRQQRTRRRTALPRARVGTARRGLSNISADRHHEQQQVGFSCGTTRSINLLLIVQHLLSLAAARFRLHARAPSASLLFARPRRTTRCRAAAPPVILLVSANGACCPRQLCRWGRRGQPHAAGASSSLFLALPQPPPAEPLRALVSPPLAANDSLNRRLPPSVPLPRARPCPDISAAPRRRPSPRSMLCIPREKSSGEKRRERRLPGAPPAAAGSTNHAPRSASAHPRTHAASPPFRHQRSRSPARRSPVSIRKGGCGGGRMLRRPWYHSGWRHLRRRRRREKRRTRAACGAWVRPGHNLTGCAAPRREPPRAPPQARAESNNPAAAHVRQTVRWGPL